MKLIKKLLKPFSAKEKIKRYFIANDYIVVIRKSKYAVVKVNGGTVFNNLKTDEKFSKWFKEFKKGYSEKLRKHVISDSEALVHERRLMKERETKKAKKIKEVAEKHLEKELEIKN